MDSDLLDIISGRFPDVHDQDDHDLNLSQEPEIVQVTRTLKLLTQELVPWRYSAIVAESVKEHRDEVFWSTLSRENEVCTKF